MSLDPTRLFVSLIAGGVGFVLFVYGKKQQRWPQLAAGLFSWCIRISLPASSHWS